MAVKQLAKSFARFARVSSLGVFQGCCKSTPRTMPFCMQHLNLSSESSSFVKVVKEEGYGVIKMNRKPVNSLNLEMLTEIADAIGDLEADSSCQGMILTSALPKIFSAGLDITEFMIDNEERFVQFWQAFQNIWLTLYGSRLATIAAVNGAAPAGGCLLTISCDYSIMAEGSLIGPNETLLGIVAPPWFTDTLVNTVGHRQTEQLLCLGKLLRSEEACDVGLVDSVVEKDDLMGEAKNELQKWLAIPGNARSQSKLQLREPTLAKLRNARQEDLQASVDFIRKESTQKVLAWYMKTLSEKSKKKK